MNRKRIVGVLASLTLSAVLIAVLLSRIEISMLIRTLRDIHRPSLLAFLLCSLAGTGLRAWRYHCLLAPRPTSRSGILLVSFIRNLFVDLLPARIGSLSYVYFVNRRLGLPFEAAASSFAISVLLDFLTLSPFLIAALLLGGLGASVLPAGPTLLIALVFFLIMIVIMLRMPQLLMGAARLLRAVFHRLGIDRKSWTEQAASKLESTSADVRSIRARRIEAPVYGLSLLIRLTKYGALFFLLFALLHSHGYSIGDLSFPKTILGITGAEMSSVMPIKGIGGFGTWESAWALTFRLLGFDAGLAVISGIGVHLITNLFEYALGVVSLLLLYFPFRRKK